MSLAIAFASENCSEMASPTDRWNVSISASEALIPANCAAVAPTASVIRWIVHVRLPGDRRDRLDSVQHLLTDFLKAGDLLGCLGGQGCRRVGPAARLFGVEADGGAGVTQPRDGGGHGLGEMAERYRAVEKILFGHVSDVGSPAPELRLVARKLPVWLRRAPVLSGDPPESLGRSSDRRRVAGARHPGCPSRTHDHQGKLGW
jgi:hypothetical protein